MGTIMSVGVVDPLQLPDYTVTSDNGRLWFAPSDYDTQLRWDRYRIGLSRDVSGVLRLGVERYEPYVSSSDDLAVTQVTTYYPAARDHKVIQRRRVGAVSPESEQGREQFEPMHWAEAMANGVTEDAYFTFTGPLSEAQARDVAPYAQRLFFALAALENRRHPVAPPRLPRWQQLARRIGGVLRFPDKRDSTA